MFYLSCYVSFFPSWCLGWDFKLNCVYSYAFCSYIALYDYGLDSFLCIDLVILVSDDTLSVAFWNGSRSSTSFSEITRKKNRRQKKKKKKKIVGKKKKKKKIVGKKKKSFVSSLFPTNEQNNSYAYSPFREYQNLPYVYSCCLND